MTGNVLAITEHRRGELRDVSFELVRAGVELAEGLGGELHAGVVSGPVEDYGERLSVAGVDRIHTVDYGEEFNHGVYTQATVQLAEEIEPTVILCPHSVNGMDYAPAVSTLLRWPIVTDVTDITVDDGLQVVRERYGSKVETEIEIGSDRAVLTLRPGTFPVTNKSADVPIEPFEVSIDEASIRSEVRGFEEVGGDVDISQADVLVAVGRGIGDEENLELVERLAEALDATIAASRPLVDAGWLPKGRQVGQSGKTVTPDVYIALGISGAVQHVAGMKGAETIIAVNTDPDAPIFDVADYGVVGDLFEVVPALIEEFGE